jgi:hypothetical protein
LEQPDIIVCIMKGGGGESSIFFDHRSTFNLIFVYITYSFSLPSFEFLMNSESDQQYLHTKIIFFFPLPYLLISFSALSHPAYSVPISAFY